MTLYSYINTLRKFLAVLADMKYTNLPSVKQFITSEVYWNSYVWNNSQRLGKECGRVGHRRTSRDHPNYSIIKIGQNP